MHIHYDHEESGVHTHSHLAEKNLRFAVIFTSIILIAEVIGGILTNSLALLSDAAHVFSDLFALVLSYVAIRIAMKPVNLSKTFGYHRSEVFAGLINGITLIIITAWIFHEAYQRFKIQEEVLAKEMLVIALIGLLANIIVALKLKEHKGDINIRAAFLHVVGDALASVGVILAGLLMIITGNYIFDPLISVIIGIIILIGSLRLINEAVHILFESVPKHINIKEVKEELSNTEGVRDIHDLHIWSICSHITLLSAHVVVGDIKASKIDKIKNELEEKAKKFKINHTTFQFESQACSNACEKMMDNENKSKT